MPGCRPPIYADKTQVTLGENYGYFNSAWSSVVVAVVANMVLSLVGFFLVKNTIERDEQTRVGPLLAATSLDSRDYLLGKCISNFLLLMSLGLVFMASIPFLQWHRGPQYPFEPLKIVTQFLPDGCAGGRVCRRAGRAVGSGPAAQTRTGQRALHHRLDDACCSASA